MADLIAHLVRVLALVFPARGKHRATPAPHATTTPTVRTAWPRRPLPTHKSPYAREVSERRSFVDTISPVRPYVLTEPRRRPDTPERRAQAERRWALEMALRGIDVGPATIHGVHVRPGSRTLRMAVSA